MKSTELMIGDFVIVKNYGIKEIIGIQDFDGVVEISDGEDREIEIPFDDIEPIPLTPEILEKNGWMQNGMTQEAIMECDGENCDDTWCEMTYDGELNCYFDYEEDAVLFTCDRGCDFLKIHFVHEFQHALRLCGLDELATNFKV